MINTSEMIVISELRRFKVDFDTTNNIDEQISNLHILYEYLRIYGRGIINKITFYFYTSTNQNHAQKVILHRSEPNDRFRFEFINQNIQKNIFDYVTIINKINTTTNLYDMLGRYIINPFYIDSNIIINNNDNNSI